MIKELLILGNIYKFDMNNVITDTRGFKYYESIFNDKKLLIHVNALLFNIGDHIILNVNGIIEGSVSIQSHRITFQKIYNGFNDIYLLLLMPKNESASYIDSYSYAFIDKAILRKKIIELILAE